MAGGGTGTPSRFHCSACRRSRVWRERRGGINDVVLTGRTRPNPSGNRGSRVAASQYEYRCPCGHVGWSNHVQLARKAGREREWVAPSASARVVEATSVAAAWEELSLAQQRDLLLALRAERDGAARALRTGRALVRRHLVTASAPDPGAAHREDRRSVHSLTARGRELAVHGASL